VILAEIERIGPPPKLASGLDWAVNWWADRLFFHTTMPIIFGTIGDSVPEAFLKDREQLAGRPFDPKAMKAAVHPLKAQWRAQIGWLEQQLQSNAAWLSGFAPGLADVAAYMNIWFLERNLPDVAAELLQGMGETQAWKARVKAVGHGTFTELDSKAALDIAKAAEPRGGIDHDPTDPIGVAPGGKVFVMADDYGRDRIEGVLVAANPERIVIAREDPAVGELNVHFPRAGYFAGADREVSIE
jgi:glutathione S-transferase